MVAGSAGVAAACQRPAAISLVALLDRSLTGLAGIVRGLGLCLLPAQPLDPERLVMTAMRARSEEPPRVARLELALDARDAMDRRGRGEKDFRPPREGARARLGERDGVAFLAGGRRIGIDLVEKKIARRHRPQAGRAVGPGDDQEACRKLLRQHGV